LVVGATSLATAGGTTQITKLQSFDDQPKHVARKSGPGVFAKPLQSRKIEKKSVKRLTQLSAKWVSGGGSYPALSFFNSKCIDCGAAYSGNG